MIVAQSDVVDIWISNLIPIWTVFVKIGLFGTLSLITVQNSGKWLTWNICTGGMGYAGYKGNMEYLH